MARWTGLRPLLLGLGSLLALVSAVSCGGSGGGSGSSSPPAEPVTAAALSAISSSYLAKLAASDPAASTKTAAELRLRPDVKEAGVTADGSPYAVFQSGAIWTVANNRTPAGRAALEPGRLTPTPRNLPKFNVGAIVSSLDPAKGFRVYGPTLAPFLKASGHKLVGDRVLAGTLEDWSSIKGAGFLYVDAHGVQVREAGGATTMGIVTASPATSAILATIQEALAKREMMLVSEIQEDSAGKPTKVDRVAITSSWLSGRGILGPGSLSFANVCYSSVIGGSIGRLGGGSFMGWKGLVTDSHAHDFAKALFEPAAKKEAERLTFDEVWGVLQAAGLMKDKTTGAELILSKDSVPFGQFLPEIDSGTLNSDNTVTLQGAFSEEKGTAYQNGVKSQALAVKSWTKDNVVVELQAATTSVTLVTQGRESNAYTIPGYIIKEADSDSFFVKNRLWITLHKPDKSLAATIHRDPVGAPEGQRGPYRFQASPGMFLYVSVHTDGPVGSNGAIRLITPDGRKIVVLNSNINEKPSSGTLVAASGYIPL